MNTHTIKCWKQYFILIVEGHSTSLVQRNDCNFQIGDHLKLVESDMSTLQVTGRECMVEVTSCLDDRDSAVGMRALKPGYCVMSVKLLPEQEQANGPRQSV